ncbi:NADH:flavin oxidoreductase [Oligoflexia bacterium]|nr:NADH:flavin oxidoreductase [Oligoflexia bacterium]
MATLFEATVLNGMQLRNRTVRSATWEGMCTPEGEPTDELIECYRELAKGEVGLIITGYAFIAREGKQLQGKMGICNDDFEASYKRMTNAVHECDGKIAIQLVHAGGQTDTQNAGQQPLAPSAIKVDQFPETPAELTTEDIQRLIEAFGAAARRAKAWGFDAVQLHGAHGYLINQFLSPLTNRRSDQYGGCVENRTRFLMEVYRKVRATVGADYPVLIKLNATDHVEGGLNAVDGLYAARRLAEEGIDAIEVSAGTAVSGLKGPARFRINKEGDEAYNLDLALGVKAVTTCAVMAVGGFRSYSVSEMAIADGAVDYISFSRPLIREPDMFSRWRQGDRTRADCKSCNNCFKPGREEGGIYCVNERKEQVEATEEL